MHLSSKADDERHHFNLAAVSAAADAVLPQFLLE